MSALGSAADLAIVGPSSTPLAGRPRRACNHCNSRKVRCNGSKPTCNRCQRLNRPCVYSRRTRPSSIGPESEVPAALTSSSGFLPSLTTPPATTPSISPSISNSERSYMGIPQTLVANLIEIYFSHLYNASLLSHKPWFLQEALEGKTRPHVILSICALASNFYTDSAGASSLRDHGFGNEWAAQAGKLAIKEIDEPSEEYIVTCVALGLYWYSQGAWRKAGVFHGNALLAAHLLGLVVDSGNKQNTLMKESRRRKYWACYLLNAFSASTPFPTVPSRHALNLTLPCREDKYEEGMIPQDVDTLKHPSRNGSIYAELIQVMTFWTEVHSFVKQLGSDELSMPLADIHSLDARIRRWKLEMPIVLRITPSSLLEIPLDALPKILLIHIVYHQCLCILHSSIVPLFSWSDLGENWAPSQQVSAQIAFEHSNHISQLLNSTLKRLPDGSRIPSFVGYAAYAACAIQLPFTHCSNPEVKANAHANVATNLRIIQWMSPYWKFVWILSVHVRHLHEIHVRNPHPIDDEPRRADARKLRRFKVDVGEARRSILGHNEVLCTVEGGSLGQGGELTDLGIHDTNITSPDTYTLDMATNSSLLDHGILAYSNGLSEGLEFLSNTNSDNFDSEAALVTFNEAMMTSTDTDNYFNLLLRDIQGTEDASFA